MRSIYANIVTVLLCVAAGAAENPLPPATPVPRMQAVHQPKVPLLPRYGLYVHADMPPVDAIDGQWKAFCALPRPKGTTERK